MNLIITDTVRGAPNSPKTPAQQATTSATEKSSSSAVETRLNSPTIDGGGLRYNAGKLRWDLIPWRALAEVTRVFTYGASKYDDRNWERGMLWTNPYASMVRHQVAWFDGEDVDAESGCPHMAHVAANALFLLHYSSQSRYRDLDNRPNYKENINGL